MALALFADDDYEETWARLAESLGRWGWPPEQAEATAGGLSQARKRLGPEPVRETFAQGAEPVATLETPGAFLGSWRLMSIDGMEWDVPDTAEDAAEFGYPGTGKDGSPSALPKARAVTVAECASHAPVLAAIGPCSSKGSGDGPGEAELSLARNGRGWRWPEWRRSATAQVRRWSSAMAHLPSTRSLAHSIACARYSTAQTDAPESLRRPVVGLFQSHFRTLRPLWGADHFTILPYDA
jgi:hypothetical protein